MRQAPVQPRSRRDDVRRLGASHHHNPIHPTPGMTFEQVNNGLGEQATEGVRDASLAKAVGNFYLKLRHSGAERI